ncbi:hypothetical protein M3210_02820 [Oceanobacillus luteolus]|uniref:hypothetical protein n=1 Tax=Oceanobacillus luteolus TaxID=1274358 RepID=UPI0020405988|nr:hypothetical protein [Oceanobacillus luteolus]MCM3739195.1 hypothetical protein [Oceanobacillus luteolus]
MRAYIKLWGREYPLLMISWYEDGGLSNVSFRDEERILFTVFPVDSRKEETSFEERYKNDLTYADLDKCIFWKEK